MSCENTFNSPQKQVFITYCFWDKFKKIIVVINYSTCSVIFSYIFVLGVFHLDLSLLFCTALLHPSMEILSLYLSYNRLQCVHLFTFTRHLKCSCSIGTQVGRHLNHQYITWYLPVLVSHSRRKHFQRETHLNFKKLL